MTVEVLSWLSISHCVCVTRFVCNSSLDIFATDIVSCRYQCWYEYSIYRMFYAAFVCLEIKTPSISKIVSHCICLGLAVSCIYTCTLCVQTCYWFEYICAYCTLCLSLISSTLLANKFCEHIFVRLCISLVQPICARISYHLLCRLIFYFCLKTCYVQQDSVGLLCKPWTPSSSMHIDCTRIY